MKNAIQIEGHEITTGTRMWVRGVRGDFEVVVISVDKNGKIWLPIAQSSRTVKTSFTSFEIGLAIKNGEIYFK